MAGLALDARLHVRPVVEVREVGQVVDPHPPDRAGRKSGIGLLLVWIVMFAKGGIGGGCANVLERMRERKEAK